MVNVRNFKNILASVHEKYHVHDNMNNVNHVIMSVRTRPRVIQQFKETLESLLQSVPWLSEWKFEDLPDARARGHELQLRMRMPIGGTAALCVVCRDDMRPGMFEVRAGRPVVARGRPDIIVPVLALPWVSPRLSELCSLHGWSWFDLAGNYLLEVPGVLRIERRGIPRVQQTVRPHANMATVETARIIRTLLVPEHAARQWTQRDLQRSCTPSVSIGLVNKVVRYLVDEAYLVQAEGGFHLQDPRRLLQAWRDMYRIDQQDRRTFHTLLKPVELLMKISAFQQRSSGAAACASFTAADAQAPHVRQPKVWIYVRPDSLAAFTSLVEAQSVDMGDNLIIMVPADEGVMAFSEQVSMSGRPMLCTNPVQTYVDLCHSGGRGAEAAEALLVQRLIPAWSKAGLRT